MSVKVPEIFDFVSESTPFGSESTRFCDVELLHAPREKKYNSPPPIWKPQLPLQPTSTCPRWRPRTPRPSRARAIPSPAPVRKLSLSLSCRHKDDSWKNKIVFFAYFLKSRGGGEKNPGKTRVFFLRSLRKFLGKQRFAQPPTKESKVRYGTETGGGRRKHFHAFFSLPQKIPVTRIFFFFWQISLNIFVSQQSLSCLQQHVRPRLPDRKSEQRWWLAHCQATDLVLSSPQESILM